MHEFTAPYEAALRLGCFAGILAVMAIWERIAPRRTATQSKRHRWQANLRIVALNTIALRFMLPVTTVGVAFYADSKEWGLLPRLGLEWWSQILVAVVLLDLIIYAQHIAMHRVPLLWRVHRMHHADLDFDVTTGNRFHPFEILLSMGIKLGAVALLGITPMAVVLFEIILNGTSMFNHSNIRLPHNADYLLRMLVVTPDMHRVHHSVDLTETNSNFGFNLPWWDRLFGTYVHQPKLGHTDMLVGLHYFRDHRCLSLWEMLKMPFMEIMPNSEQSPWSDENSAQDLPE